MDGSMKFSLPAGYESDVSSDEQWECGHKSHKQPPPLRVKYVDADDPDAQDNVSLLKRAINSGDTVAVEQLLDKGVDSDSKLDFDWSPLMCAVATANYDLAKLLLDRGASANFSKDHWTVLMACCTASASEVKIAACVGLLLSRNADPNMADRSHMTCLMLAAREGYAKVIAQLVSHGARINTQDNYGYTALSTAVQYGREEAVLKLLQLGADQTLETKKGKSPANLAEEFKHTEIAKILASFHAKENTSTKQMLSVFYSANSACPFSIENVSKMNDLELFLHGLNLGYLTDMLTNKGVVWNDLLNMDRKDLEMIGITDPVDQQKVLGALQQMQLDKVDLDTLDQLGVGANGSEELQSFLLGVSQQCCYLTETLQDVIKSFPHHASQLVFSLDSKQDAQATCSKLVVQTTDLQKQVICLRTLLCQMADSRDCCRIPRPESESSWRTNILSRITLCSVVTAFLLVFCKAACGRLSLHWCRI